MRDGSDRQSMGYRVLGRALATAVFIIGFLALGSAMSGCSSKATPTANPARQTLPQLPEPTPTSEPSATPSPGPSPSPTPSPSPVPSPTPVACDPSALAPWTHWSVFASNDANVRGMDIAEGLAGRNLKIDGLDLGYGLPRYVGRYDLVADDLEFQWTTVNAGSAAYFSRVKFREGVDVYGGTRKVAALDFDAEYEKLVDLQFRLLDLKVNGTTVRICNSAGKECEIRLTGNHAQVNRFRIEASELSQLRKIVVQVPRKATAVVLIQSRDVNWKDLEVSAPAETVWTLGEPHGKFKIDFMTLPGTVVLAASTFEIDQALLMGRVLTKDFQSAPCHDDRACATVDSQELPARICL